MNVFGAVSSSQYTVRNPLQYQVPAKIQSQQVSKPSDGDGDHGVEPHKGQLINVKA